MSWNDEWRLPRAADDPFVQAGPWHPRPPRVHREAAMRVRSVANGAFCVGLAMVVLGFAFSAPSLLAIGCILSTMLTVCLHCLAMDLGHGTPRPEAGLGGESR
jgi:hypothetical protein